MRLVRVIDLRFRPAGGEWLQIALGAPHSIDQAGEYVGVDVGGLLEDALGGGIQATEGAEVELRVRWIAAPWFDEDDE